MGYPNNTQRRPLYTIPFGQPTAARQLAAGASSASTALTAGTKAISIRAITADIRFVVGVGTQTANAASSHFITQNERLNFRVPEGASIGIIRDASTSGTLELTELV